MAGQRERDAHTRLQAVQEALDETALGKDEVALLRVHVVLTHPGRDATAAGQPDDRHAAVEPGAVGAGHPRVCGGRGAMMPWALADSLVAAVIVQGDRWIPHHGAGGHD